jgi:hypothetical protein
MVFTTSLARPAAFVVVGINNETSTTAITTLETLIFILEIAISNLLNPP